VALAKVASDDAPEGSMDPELSWFSPFAVDSSDALISALLIGVFIYWGWESAVNLTEETTNSRRSPGLAAIASTLILLVTYVSVATAVVAFAGLEALGEFDDDEGVFSFLAADVLGSPWDKLVVLAIVTSAIASTQTTIIPASRTTMSMGRADALPRPFAAIHRRYQTPAFSTAVVAALAIAWYVPSVLLSENFLFDTLSALALLIAFYYALSGLACVIYYRRELTRSFRSFVFIGVAPLVGAVILGFLFVRAAIDLADPDASYTGGSILGFGTPLVIGASFLILGVVLVGLWRLGGHERFFSRRPFEAVDPALVEES
jgi:amino acid transporter